MAKTDQYIETVKSIQYRLTVTPDNKESFERAKQRGSWIRMVALAEKIENLTAGTVIKSKKFDTISGVIYFRNAPDTES